MASNWRFQKILCSILAVSLVLSSCPGIVQSAQATTIGVDTDRQSQPVIAAPSTPQELPDYRTSNSQRFLNPDGSLTEKLYTHPIHYKEPASGRWQPIDSAIVSDGKGKFRNKSNRFAVELQPEANAGYFTFSEGGATLSFRPLFASKAKGAVKKNLIEYKKTTPNTDLSYAVTENGLKETITLHNAKVPTVFSFELKLDNLTYQSRGDGAVVFSKKGNNASLFVLARPFAVDASLEMSNKTAYHIHEGNNGNLLLDLEVDADWLQDPKRTFPVVIDPVIKTQNAPDVDDTLISSKNPYDNYGNWSHLYVGQAESLGTTRSLFWFNLANLPSSAVISSANLNVKNTVVYASNQTPVIETHRILDNWVNCNPALYSNCVSWNNQPKVGGIDGSYTARNTGVSSWALPVTGLVRDWYNGQQANYGMELKYANESQAVRELVATEDISDPTAHPYLSINYTVDGLGVQPFWTFDGTVNMGNRNLVLSATDIRFPGRAVTVSLKRTYNSRSNQSGVFGYGWSSPLDMRLYTTEGGPARLIDGDGSVHYFAMNSEGEYASPPGLFWNLSTNGTTATVTK